MSDSSLSVSARRRALQQIEESKTTPGLTDRSPAKRLAASQSQSLRFRARECDQKGKLVRYRLKLQISFIALAIIPSLVTSASSQQAHVLLNDARALVTQVEIPPGETYTLQGNQEQTVWVTLDAVLFSDGKGGDQPPKRAREGDAVTLNKGGQIEFRSANNSPARLVVVRAKMVQQVLTVESLSLTGSLEDASARNATLFVGISSCHFQDIRNRGDESEWLPGSPERIVMQPGNVRWINPGIHHFQNLGPGASKLVTIEW